MTSKPAKSGFLFLPRSPSATKLFAVCKLLLILLFLAYMLFVLLWTGYCMSLYRARILADPDGHLANLNKTHRHFFLFTGLYVSAAVAIGLWSVLKENVTLSTAFGLMLTLGFVFELVGALKSRDMEVQRLKVVTGAPEIVLLIFALIFDFMIWKTEKQLSSLPIYRQTMVESRNASTVDLKSMDELHGAEEGGGGGGRGADNPVISLDDERGPNENNNVIKEPGV